MYLYLCEFDNKKAVFSGFNKADAALKFDDLFTDEEIQFEDIEDLGLNTYCEELLAKYQITEISLQQAVEYISKKIETEDLDFTISI